MTAPIVRRLLVDLETPIPRLWNGGDAFRTALFDALSFSFPAGEQVFIDSVRMGLDRLDAEQRARLEAELRGFIGQEATHRRVHTLFNEHLARRGLVNHWEGRIARRVARRMHGVDERIWLGVTSATEHFTAILAEYLLGSEMALAGTEPRLAQLWRWHSAEESEHRCVAFDLYRTLDGSERWRRRLYFLVTWNFTTDLVRQTLNNLWHDGTWWRWSTWTAAARFLVGRGGVLRFVAPRWRDYLREDFHPSQGDGRLGEAWLQENTALFKPVA